MIEDFLSQFGHLMISAATLLVQAFIIHRLGCEKKLLTCIKEDTAEVIKPVLAEEMVERIERLERVLLGVASNQKKEE